MAGRRRRREWGVQRSHGTKHEAGFTALQGQYLAFIRAYTVIHRVPPAEADMQRFFRVTPPSVHAMVLTLEGRGLITRIPGQARSIRLLVPAEDLPMLEERPIVEKS